MLRVLVNKVLHLFEVRTIKTNENVVYLTFDDGPEPGIVEFILDELAKYNFKATFFCRGDNAEKYLVLFHEVRKLGHSIGNHTYSHLSGITSSSHDFINDVKKANAILNASLFRPPRGFLRLRAYLYIVFILKMRVVHWSLSSNDYDLDNFNLEDAILNLQQKTKPGDIVLFHSCGRHAVETKKLLPVYLNWLKEHKYKSYSL